MEKKPNVLLIISDQWSTKHIEGYTGVKTPTLCDLKNEGISFEQSYSSYPLCCPARASIFTGTMPHENNIIDNTEIQKMFLGEIPYNDNLITMGEAFKNSGYDTAYFGKEHAGGYGWDNIDEFGSMTYSGGGMIAEGSAYDTIFTKDAIDYLNKDERNKNPFYMTLSLINPHDICKAFGERLQDLSIADMMMFGNEDVPYLRNQQRGHLPENFNYKADKGMILYKDNHYSDLDNDDVWNEDKWKKYISVYNLLIEKTDWYMKLVLDTLKQKGLDENTIVVFTTDHGDMMGSHKLVAKTTFYEESAKTFMVLKYPKLIKKGIINNKAFIGTNDLMPTILDLCDIEIPITVSGKSFKKECLGEESGKFEEVYCENPHSRMVRFQNYKYVISGAYKERYDVLFDLEADPLETTNVYNKTGYEEISKKANKMLTEWIEKEGIGNSFDYDEIYGVKLNR